MEQLPIYVSILFVLITIITVTLFYFSSPNKNVLYSIVLWALITGILGLNGFFTNTSGLPPRFFFLILFPLITIIATLSMHKGKLYISSMNLKTLTALHTIRIAVEGVLYLLFVHKLMPQLMTFEGRNMDIISGLTAPIMYWLYFKRKSIGPKVVFAWNLLCLLILLFTVTNAVLSTPTPFQQFAFDQPSVAVAYFPFLWLPAIVVPIVVFSHLVALKHLWKEIVLTREAMVSSIV
jgi:hypothetical protein